MAVGKTGSSSKSSVSFSAKLDICRGREGIGGKTGLEGGGLDRMKDAVRGIGGEDRMSCGLSSEKAGVSTGDSGERPSS